MKKIIFLSLLLLLFSFSIIFGNVGSVTGVTMVPGVPLGMASVQISWNYTITGSNENPKALMFISDSTTLRFANTSGQWLMMNQIWPTVPSPTAEATNGYQVAANVSAGSYAAGPYTITLPADLVPGVTYYIIIAMSNNYLGVYNNNIDQVQAVGVSAAFTIPLPPPAVSLVKTAEVSPVQPGELVLYTINYSYVNVNNITITDDVPPECTFISASAGGTLSGSTITWNIASTPGPAITGNVWFVARVNALTPPSTTIHNIAHYVTADLPPLTGDSNDATLVTGLPFSIIKSSNPVSGSTAVIGDTVTYSFDFNAGGMSFYSYDSFDNNIAGFHDNGGAGVWSWNAGFGGCLYSIDQAGYPHYLRDTPNDFCFGELQGDVYIIDNNDKDALLVFRDGGTTASCAYGVGISPDGNGGTSATALWVQKFCGGVGAYTQSVFASISTGRWYTIKIRVTDAGNLGNGWIRIEAKAWQRGTAEPGAWAINWIDSSGTPAPCGYVGFQGNGTNANYYDNLKVFKSNQTNPRVFDTLPAELTYVGGTAADTTHAAPTNTGGFVKWNIFTSLTNLVYHLELWATVNYCGVLNNIASFDTDEVSPQVDTNMVTLNVPVCPQTPTFTPTYTASPTATPSFTPTSSPTSTPTATPTATRTNTPIIPQFTISKAVVPGSAGRGETVTYTIHYVNTGLIGLTNFEVWDTLPTEIENIAGVTAPGVYTSATGIINWIIPFVATGASGDVSFTATLKNTVSRDQVIGNRAYGNVLLANSAVESNVANVTANVPLLELTPVTNYPNPFDGATTIVFDLTILADNCSIKFFTISGEPVKTMDFAEIKRATSLGGGGLDANPPAKNAQGTWTYKVYWDGTNTAGNKLSSGVYLYRIKASAGNEEKKAMGRLAILR